MILDEIFQTALGKNPLILISLWKLINVQSPPNCIHLLNDYSLSGPDINNDECPKAFAGVLTDVVRKLQPSIYDEASSWVNHEVTKVVPVNYTPKLK